MAARKISRRQALATAGSVSLGGLIAACSGDSPKKEAGGPAVTAKAKPSSPETAELFEGSARCEVATELTEGPYYFDVDSIRGDIREDREGTRLALAIRVRDAGTCEPLENAVVDIWHCDARGSYSGFESASPGGGRSDDETYLRGAQVTNGQGIVEFTTIYPGRYPGRTVHIHVKVHLDRQTLLTTQLFTNREFDERVFAQEPYSGATADDTSNDDDSIYDKSLELTLSEEGDGVLGVMTFDVRRA